MKGKSFTLIELIIVVMIVGILVTIAVPTYQNIIENSKQKVCELNQDALGVALDIYMMEHDTIPGDLSQIPEDYLRRAYAFVMQRPDAWKIRLAYFIIDLSEKDLAYANARSFLTNDLAKGIKSLLVCPRDPDPAAHNNISYGINRNLQGISKNAYKTFNGILIGDCNASSFSANTELSERHITHRITGTETFAMAINKGEFCTIKGGVIKKKVPRPKTLPFKRGEELNP